MITVDQDADNGMGDVILKNVEPFDVFVDPKSRDIFYRDAAYIMIHKVMPQSHLSKLLPEYKNKIKNANASDQGNYNYSQKAEGNDFQYKAIED